MVPSILDASRPLIGPANVPKTSRSSVRPPALLPPCPNARQRPYHTNKQRGIAFSRLINHGFPKCTKKRKLSGLSGLTSREDTTVLLTAMATFQSTLDEDDEDLPPELVPPLIIYVKIGSCSGLYPQLLLLIQLAFSIPRFRKSTHLLLLQLKYVLALSFYPRI